MAIIYSTSIYVGGVGLKPIVNIDFNGVFVNTKIHYELSAVVYGAELALRYANIPGAQSKEIKNRIIRSAFESFSLDYEKMAAASQGQPEAQPGASPEDLSGRPAPARDMDNEYANNGESYEQTVVYENYPDPTKVAALDPEPPDGYGSLQNNTWEEQPGPSDQDDGFGKIHWTTYSSAAGLGGDQPDNSFGQFEGDSEDK